MPSLVRTLFVAVHAAALAVLVGSPFTTTSALASPMAMPLPLITADHSLSSIAAREAPRKNTKIKSMRIKHAVSHNLTTHHAPLPARQAAVTKTTPSTPAMKRQSNILSNIDILNTYLSGANGHANNLKSLAAKSHSVGNSDSQFQQQAATEMTGFHENLLGFQDILAQLGADKGLANYDKSDELETLLKDLVNANKDALSATTVLVYNIPGLGPILGPIVYEIKCILDEILDLTENLTDAIINALKPLLVPLIGQATTTCTNIAGLCV